MTTPVTFFIHGDAELACEWAAFITALLMTTGEPVLYELEGQPWDVVEAVQVGQLASAGES